MPHPSPIIYPIANTSDGKLDAAKLVSEIAASALSNFSNRVKGSGTNLYVYCSADTTDDDKTNILDPLITSHKGAITLIDRIETSTIIEGEVAITETTSWQDLSGIATTLGAFLSDANEAVGKLVGQIKTIGDGFEMRMVKQDGTSLLATAYTHEDSAGVWEKLEFSTDQPPVLNFHYYNLQARLNGATSASIRSVRMTLLKVRAG